MKPKQIAILSLIIIEVLLLCRPCQAQQRGLFPAVLNLASGALITVNATCGERGPEMYCKMVEHVPGQPVRNPQCRLCEMCSSAPITSRCHPITSAIDGKNTWWQSPSIQNGMEYHYVTITLDLRQVFQIAYVIVKAANSPRPGNWILERSLDGVTYSAWQYYAVTDSECITRYNIVPQKGPPSYRKDDEVICTSYYSKIHPLEHGEIHTSLVNGRPSADDPSPVLLEFTSARYIRLRLQRIRTLNADLMTLTYQDPNDLDPIVTRRYYYSVKDISVGGMCICYGHAKACPTDPVTGKSTCECQHNTCGESCDRCCPGFHQKPWRAGTFLVKYECEPCNCHRKTKDCYYDDDIAKRNWSLNIHGVYSGGGVCTNCANNTAGINCETCKDGFFRPQGVSPLESDPCQPCDCDAIGSEHNTCIKDEKHARGDLFPGFCICRPGYAGSRCDQCAFGYTNYPNCILCNCSLHGSRNLNPCEEPCICKENVEGEKCEHCKKGFFNIQRANPKGCEECFCSGVSNLCTGSSWTYSNITGMSGWYLTGLSDSAYIFPRQDSFDGPQQLSVSHSEARRVLSSPYYWSAPSPYLGNKVTSYGGKLTFTVSYDIIELERYVEAMPHIDVILEGNGLRISSVKKLIQLQPFREYTQVLLMDPTFFILSASREPVSKKDFMTILTNVTRLLITATYSNETEAIYRLSSVTLDLATSYSTGLSKATAVEICYCPHGYSGTSCEKRLQAITSPSHAAVSKQEVCLPGYRKVNSTLPSGRCERCQCFGHADSCTDFTGWCQNCQHNTTGPFCNECLPGYYGDPTQQTPHDCQQCACPFTSPSNNFSPTCHLDHSGELICDQCLPGYAGPRCDRCAEGYYGNPMTEGGSCQPCQCNNNLDLSVPGSCDPKTGACLICRAGTAGDFCEQCANGYFGNAVVERNCKPCHCHVNGSLSHICNQQTGQCECRSNVTGRRCDECLPNCWWDHEKQVCIPCNCSPVGSMSLRCDMLGRCLCKPGFTGKRCSLSRQFFEYREMPQSTQQAQIQRPRLGASRATGSRGCPRGAYRPITSPGRGPGTYGVQSSRGCVPCNCNSFGSKSFDCDGYGQCTCQPGVTGIKCDHCAFGFFDFQEGGCTPCSCELLGNNCDPETGVCICPPNTIGEKCNKCAPNHWGHDIVTGCKPCDCTPEGSLSTQCNPETGCCFCRPEFGGDKCNECKAGYRDYPQCSPCSCVQSGADPESCDPVTGLCSCANQMGQCTCKVNVEGPHCDRCKPGTFGLSAENPLGCSNCYCFGLTTQCSEAVGLIRMWLTLKPEQMELSLVDQMNHHSTSSGVSFQHPEIVLNVDAVIKDTLTEPFYWKLPQQFEGLKLTAYGGKIKYAIYFEAREEIGRSTYEPQIIIRGGSRKEKVIVRHMPAPQIGQLTRHEIDVTEHGWRYYGSIDGNPVTREDFMTVLYDIDYILIKASYGNVMRQSRISEISMEVAEIGETSIISERARQIEKCECLPGYSGLSCQECVPGLYRLPSSSSEPGLGRCVPCQCHGHSDTCDRDTSVCQNCLHNTAGDHCERCAPGYYGIITGSPDDCQPCACPLRIASNNFSPTCITEGPSSYRCTACPRGYEGQHCERCAAGFYGSPTIPGRSCQECECDFYGALPAPCDTVTGQCQCIPGATGPRCDGCMHRHVRDGMNCISCDDECTGLLLNDLDHLNQMAMSVNLTGPLPLPYKTLYRFENLTQELKPLLSPHRAPGKRLQLAESKLGGLITEMDDLLNRANKVSADGEQTSKDVDRANKRANDLENLIKDAAQESQAVKDKASSLNAILTGHGAAPEKSLQELQHIAEMMMAELRRRNLHPHQMAADKELGAAEVLLQRVKKLFSDPHGKNEGLKNKVQDILSDYKTKLDDIEDMLKEARDKSREANALLMTKQPDIAALEKKKQAVDNDAKATKAVLEEGKQMLVEVSHLLNWINDDTDNMEAIKDEIEGLSKELNDKINGLTETMKEKQLLEKVSEAESRADVLKESSEILDGILAEAKNLSFNATAAFRAYSNIKDFIEEAGKLAKEAKAQAMEAAQLASGPPAPLKETAKGSLQKSFRLLSEAKLLANDVKDNEEHLDDLQTRLGNADSKNKDLMRSINDTLKMLHSIPNDTAVKLQEVKEKARQANDTANGVLAKIKDLNQDLLGLKNNYSKLEDDVKKASAATRDPTKNIAEADAKVKDLENEADRLLNKLRPIKELQDNIGRNISQIKEMINQARKQANSIKVSVSSGGDCIRTYKPEIKKGRLNKIILNVKTAVPDNLLFYLGSNKFTDFLAIEMRHGKVNFLWDVGSGVGRVEYPDFTIHDQNWHRIEATRYERNGTISVQALEGPNAGMMPKVYSALSPETYTVLDVDAHALLFVGGLTGKVKKADAVKTVTFTGCMGETYFDDKPIGLWNYRDKQGDCKGCSISPQPADVEGTVQFDGEGYAAVSRPTRWNPNMSTIMFKFKTFSSDGLLMYMATKDLKDFMSIELSDGHIKVIYDLGSGTGEVISSKSHNDGKWKSFTLSRIQNLVNISIANLETSHEEKMSTTSKGHSSGLNLKDDDRIYFGGLSSLANIRPEVNLRKYAGCLKDIEVSRSSYNLLSSLDYVGITKGCSLEKLHKVSFQKPGYVELKAAPFNPGSKITLSFSTKNDSGIILLGTGSSPPRRKRQAGQAFYGIFLNSGRLEVLMSTGAVNPSRVTLKPEAGIFHDGKEHSISIERAARKTFSVKVDEGKMLTQTLPNDQPINVKKLFVGGIPSNFQALNIPKLPPFEGCIWNLVIDSNTVNFAQHAKFENAELGYCPESESVSVPEEEEEEEEDKTAVTVTEARPELFITTTIEPLTHPSDSLVAEVRSARFSNDLDSILGPCAGDVSPAVLHEAKQFGLARNSHVTIDFDDTKVRQSTDIQYEVRTEADSGLMFYVARINHADFITVQLKDGMPYMAYDLGHGNTSTHIPKKINDGQWHKITAHREGQRGVLTVDDETATATSPRKADILDVVGKLYIGGLPINYTTKRIGPVVYSIHACIRNFKLMGVLLDMDKPSSSYRVGNCFTNPEKGTYFDGTGFAKAVGGFNIGMNATVEFEFRTSQWSGVFLGVSGQKMKGMGIEMINGEILFNADNGAGVFSAVYMPEAPGSLCDGQWHKVVARKAKATLELTVDGNKVEGRSLRTDLASADTNDPVFVGGYPDDSKQVGLTSKTRFKGCIKNLKLIKGSRTQEIDFRRALELIGVQPLTCPAQ
ncbi:laminin subunit alpha-2 isoform X4 [Protopterus annectens]|uniref:laminin subunit alpha-2 isoform X4 n=1 Tax=Protopterus annectens TaxID=7888 RepID=UPI001CF93D67|nr:laminin subunit alpha-2 isoform X4 [Protopterus annectens]